MRDDLCQYREVSYIFRPVLTLCGAKQHGQVIDAACPIESSWSSISMLRFLADLIGEGEAELSWMF